MTSATSNINQFWAYLVVEELVRCGVDHFFLAPGSRSTPLVVAIAEHPRATHTIHYDERGTSFAALGYARATGRPACWVTTSGSALANGFPAIVEASADRVPMVLLTADRPPELRDTGANQTIDQVKLFGGYVRRFVDLPAPTVDIAPGYVLTTIDAAVHAARTGPVHLNAMFREPLAPTASGFDAEAYGGPVAGWRSGEAPFTTYEQPASVPAGDTRAEAVLRTARRGLILAGRLPSTAAAQAVAALAAARGWPLVADIGSQLRLDARTTGAIAHGEMLVGTPAFAGAHAPDCILQVGDRLTSKRLFSLPASHPEAVHIVVHPSGDRLDPLHGVSHRVEADIAAFCTRLAAQPADAAEAGWLHAWREADRRAGEALDAHVAGGALTEPAVARLVSRWVPEGSALCLASSMPIRDMDRFAASSGAGALVVSNRGASGIDGTFATAAGVAIGHEGPVILVMGDLAFLHDLNSMPLLKAARGPLVVVLVNNQGGGIFSFLPISTFPHVFEHYFATPHDHAFAHAASLFGVPYAAPADEGAFREAFFAALSRPGPSLIEVRTDRQANLYEHRALDQAITALFSPQ
ncbi:MAG: 2-succinyl-5-enolpyruvyl-6-hydroxy-3-cyclohexene-1-carboxylic-acid synthase [Rhodothermales bacterium]